MPFSVEKRIMPSDAESSLSALDHQQNAEMKNLLEAKYSKAIIDRAVANTEADVILAKMNEALTSKEYDLETLLLGLSPFQGDLGIVGHAGESILDITEQPKDAGKYTLSAGANELEMEKLRSANVVLIIQCMDKDGAKKTYENIVSEYEGQGITPVLLSIGGGIAQEDSIVQNVYASGDEEGYPQEMKVNRQTGLRLAVASVQDFVTKTGGEVVAVHALTHNCRCGACAFYNNGQGVPEMLGVAKGSQEENEIMLDIAAEKAEEILRGIIDSNKIHVGMANFGEDTGNGSFKREFVGIKKVASAADSNPTTKKLTTSNIDTGAGDLHDFS